MWFFFILTAAGDVSAQSWRILVLHSYHPEFYWTASIHQGILEQLDNRKDIHLYVEYMDTKRFSPESLHDDLVHLFKTKYGNLTFDVVISSDDNAFNFLLKERSTLFNNAPIVFCGVNNYSPARLQGQQNITGIAEEVDFLTTTQLILDLFPNTKHIAVVSDITQTGLLHQKKYDETVIPLLSNRVTFERLYRLAPEELTDKLKALPPDSAVMDLTYWRDPSGKSYTHRESNEMVTTSSAGPVFTAWDHTVQHGILGGITTNGRLQGKLAMSMALRILEGEPADSIPILDKSPNSPMFDYSVLQKFNISPSKLPPGSELLNEPESFYYRYRYILAVVAVALLLQSIAIMLLGFNIRKRRGAQKRLLASQARFRELVEWNPAPTIVCDLHGAIVLMNQSFTETFGYQQIDTIGALEEYMGFTIRTALSKEQGLISSDPKNTIVLHADGSSRFVDIRFRSLDEQNIYIFNDLTSFHLSEEKRRQIEVQMQHAQKLESLGVLAGGIAHDFNNMLMAMLGYADLSLTVLPPENPAYGYIEQMETSARRAADLTNQLLAYSGKGRFVVERLDMNRLVEEMGHLLRSVISRKINLNYRFAENLPAIEGDATQIRQVVMNLITNASDAIGEQHGSINITTGTLFADKEYLQTTYTQSSPEEGTYSYIEVSDTGVGMDRQTLEKLFDPFFTTKFSGRGLGLAAVLGIVRGHGGLIKVYSEPGKGSSFKILFPPISEEAMPAVTPEHDGDTKDIPLSGKHILIVDDEKSVREIGKEMAEMLGFVVQTAVDGSDALRILSENTDNTDIVLLDMMMPNMDGEETFRILHRKYPDINVVLTSGYNQQDATSHFIGKGLAGFIQKPFTLANLRNKLIEALASETTN